MYSRQLIMHFTFNLLSSSQAIKGMKRKNPKEDKWMLLRKDNIQASPHTPITDRLGAAEKKIRKEIAIMKKCRHAHVVRLLEVIDDRMQHKIYMGECAASSSPSFPLLVHTFLPRIIHNGHNIFFIYHGTSLCSGTNCNLTSPSHGISRRWRNQVEKCRP